MKHIKPIPLVIGLLLALGIALFDSPLHDFGAYGSRPARAAAVTALMAFYWLTEALPISVTACIPLVVFPFIGVFGEGFAVGLKGTVSPYVDPYIFLFLGGMCVAAAMQQWNLHRRIAVTIMSRVGTEPQRLLLGILAASALISMWISNTATAAMLVPIGIAVIRQLEAQSERRFVHFGAAIMLAIAYGANVGGIGTKIGTAPNAQFAQFMQQNVGVEVSFLQFMAVGTPFVLLFIPIVWWVLWRLGRADAPHKDVGAAVVATATAEMGPMSRGEQVVLGVFAGTAALWMAGSPLHGTLAPIVNVLYDYKLTSAHVEGGIAMLAALFLMVFRVGGQAVLTFKSLRFVPWDTLILLGGAFSMARGVQESGLSAFLGEQLRGLAAHPVPLQVLGATVATVALTAFTSNVATIGVMLNVLKDAVTPHALSTVLFAATIAASLDFALPAGTPPNAIVFGSGYLTVRQMVKTGAVLDVVGALFAAAYCLLIVPLVL